MFSFFWRKSRTLNDRLGFIGSDIHNHVLPGIDDGSPDCTSSKILLEGLLELGFNRFVCTPHILAQVHPNTSATIAQAYKELKQHLGENGLDADLSFAAEYMLEPEFEPLVLNDSLLSFGKEKYILVEMSYLSASPNLKQMIFELLTRGYHPILAHPERYNFYHHNFSIYEEISDSGCLFQLNLLSLIGYYGDKSKMIAEKLIERNLVQWVGTDLHHERHLDALNKLAQNSRALKYLEKISNLKNPDWKNKGGE